MVILLRLSPSLESCGHFPEITASHFRDGFRMYVPVLSHSLQVYNITWVLCCIGPTLKCDP